MVLLAIVPTLVTASVLAAVAATAIGGGLPSTGRGGTRRRAPGRGRSLSRDEALAGLLHDLAGPLTLIRGHCLALAQSTASAAVLEHGRLIDAEAVRLSALVTRARDLAAVRPPQIPARAPVSVAAFLAETAERHRAAAEAAGVSLSLATPHPAVSVPADAGELRRLLDNLVHNAVRHAGAHGRVRLEGERAGRRVLLRVSDTGPGVGAEDRHRIFRPFERGRDARGAGSGLGLAIARGIARNHRGRLDLDAGGEGASFRLLLPRLRKWPPTGRRAQ